MQQTDSNNHCISRIMLAEGCELTVLSAVESQQAALALSFATGSHDEPVQYLGMAHFLEHLVFRGSDNFATDDGLMAFIQRKGGRVNAQTQAAQTLFHFQVESPLFLEALARLVDMLVAPSLESATLVSEREVIHEEFKMYCQAPQILLDAALAPCLLTDHPLQRFYAGSRETLPIEDAAFASTLATFHQDAYLYSPLKIVLVLPHEWSQWQSNVLGILQPLTHMPRKRVARVLPDLQVATEAALKVNVPCADNELVLHIPINQHGQGVSELADKMQHALALTMDGMFLTYAQQQGWCSAIKVRAAYQAGEQSVLSVCFSHASAQSNALLSAFMQWLKQWRVQLQTAKQRLYEQQAQAHRWLVAEPLHKAQQLLTSGWAVDQGVSTECLAAIDAVLAAVTARAFVHVFASADDLAGSYDQGLPLKIEPVLHAGNHMVTTLDVPRFLFASDLTASASKVNHTVATELVHLRRYQPVSFPQGLATCYWGWSLEQPQAAGQSLGARLADLSELLSYNAVRWQVETVQGYVFLCITGSAEYVPCAINQILNALEQPLAAAPFVATGHFALRRLLQHIPQVLADDGAQQTAMLDLANQPQAALWLGGSDPLSQIEPRYLQRLEDFTPKAHAQPSPSGWRCVSDSGTDDALLVVHIPLPAGTATSKDQMRLISRVFAQHWQAVLQRYLREQRGLCYAVFVLPYAQGEHEGLSCAVQSSKVSAAQLLLEIQDCLADYYAAIAQHLPALLADLRSQAHQLQQGALGIDRLSQMFFRYWCEQRLETGAAQELHTVQALTAEDLQCYVHAIQDQQHWLLLSNQPANT